MIAEEKHVLSSRRRGARASPVMDGAAGLRPQPLGDLERNTDLEAVAGQRERKKTLGALEAVEDRVAVSVQRPGGACGGELLADVHAQRVAQFAVGAGELAERPRDEL